MLLLPAYPAMHRYGVFFVVGIVDNGDHSFTHEPSLQQTSFNVLNLFYSSCSCPVVVIQYIITLLLFVNILCFVCPDVHPISMLVLPEVWCSSPRHLPFMELCQPSANPGTLTKFALGDSPPPSWPASFGNYYVCEQPRSYHSVYWSGFDNTVIV